MTSNRADLVDIQTDAPRRHDLVGLGAEALADILTDLARANSEVGRVISHHLSLSEVHSAIRSRNAGSADEPYMVGSSAPMRRVFDAIRKFAATDAPVLITGESGTGKELAALAIHERSTYAGGSFVPINCAGLPPTLISSELFGHEKGAFTGAHQRKIGRIESAQGGTVFLDEIGDLPLELQPHLLRFLQESTIDRLGGNRPIKVDVRVVAATNKDLSQEVKAGRFREDLFYRLNVLSIELPPLRERGDDIDVIAGFFLRQFASEMSSKVRGFTREALVAMRQHSWPGNVRELIGRIRRAVVIAEQEWMSVDDLGLVLAEPLQSSGVAAELASGCAAALGSRMMTGVEAGTPTLEKAKSQFEAAVVRMALDRNGRNVTSTAQDLGVSRVTLYRLIDKHGLRAGTAQPAY